MFVERRLYIIVHELSQMFNNGEESRRKQKADFKRRAAGDNDCHNSIIRIPTGTYLYNAALNLVQDRTIGIPTIMKFYCQQLTELQTLFRTDLRDQMRGGRLSLVGAIRLLAVAARSGHTRRRRFQRIREIGPKHWDPQAQYMTGGRIQLATQSQNQGKQYNHVHCSIVPSEVQYIPEYRFCRYTVITAYIAAIDCAPFKK